MVHGMMILFAPVAWPIAKLLDWILGHDAGNTYVKSEYADRSYKKAELKSFLQFHREGEEPLRDDEITILNGVLSLNDRHVNEIMTPIGDCLILPADKVLNREAVDQIVLSGFSRIPVHEPGQPDNFIGMLLVKRVGALSGKTDRSSLFTTPTTSSRSASSRLTPCRKRSPISTVSKRSTTSRLAEPIFCSLVRRPVVAEAPLVSFLVSDDYFEC